MLANRLLLAAVWCASLAVAAEFVRAGAGGYATTLPPGQTGPQSKVYRTASGPVPTHKFWTSKYWTPFGTSSAGSPIYLHPQPLSVRTSTDGLTLGYSGHIESHPTWYNQPIRDDITVTIPGLHTAAVNVAKESDWAVTLAWDQALNATLGRGFPFVYFETSGIGPRLTFSQTPTIFADLGNVLGITIDNTAYGLFCPAGSKWLKADSNALACKLPAGHGYFSIAVLPDAEALAEYAKAAFSFPTNTAVDWSFDALRSQVTTTFHVTVQQKEGVPAQVLLALYPHQYSSLRGEVNTPYQYVSPRGVLKVLRGTSFSTVDVYHGILPFLPPDVTADSLQTRTLLKEVTAESQHYPGSDAYSLGKEFNRIAQLLPIALQSDSRAAFQSLKESLETKMRSWLSPSQQSNSGLFYYDATWGTLLALPASFGSADSLNDHHFHYGYWIHAASLLALFDPQLLADDSFGPMLDLLRQDIANTDRANKQFPFLRYFDPYAGHSWASGQAPFADGGNEESSSEAVNAWAGLILYGSVTHNDAVRDTGIWLYTLETNAAFYYWFNDGPVKSFPPQFSPSSVANLFDAKSDTATWFGTEPDFEHAIEFLPFTAASLYLGRDKNYVDRNLQEVRLQSHGKHPWPDLIAEYEALTNPVNAFREWKSATSTFDGESRAHEYDWLSKLLKFGSPDPSITANTTLYTVFVNPASGQRTHAVCNPGNNSIHVAFSDNYTTTVPAHTISSEVGSCYLAFWHVKQ